MARARLPSAWLFTDDRLGGARADDPLWRALARLPRGSGVVFRHYGWPRAARASLFRAVQALCRRRGLLLVAADPPRPWPHLHRPAHGPQGREKGPRPRGAVRTAAAHDRVELLAAFRRGADLVFLSPLYATASHPGGRTLGRVRFGLAARRAPGPVAALGGLTRRRAAAMAALGACGWGAIDAWVDGRG